MSEAEPRKVNPFRKWLSQKPKSIRAVFRFALSAFVIVAILATVAMVVDPTMRYISSPAHAADAYLPSLIFGVPIGVLLSFLIYLDDKRRIERPVIWPLAIAFSPFFCVFVVRIFVMDFSGQVAAALFGHDQTLILTIESDRWGYSRRCSNYIDFTDFFGAQICNVPKSLQSALHDGQKVALHGVGTSWGIFAQQLEPLPN